MSHGRAALNHSAELKRLCKTLSRYTSTRVIVSVVFYDFVSAAEVAYRLRQYIYAIEFFIRAIELILNNLHRAQINRDGIVVQIGAGTYYVYFKTISELIELVKDIEVHDNSVIYILAIVVKRLIHEMREKAGF